MTVAAFRQHTAARPLAGAPLLGAPLLGAALAGLLMSGCSFLFGDGGGDNNPPPGTPDGGTDPNGCDIAALAAQCPVSSRPLFGNDAISRCAILDETTGGYSSGLDAGICQGEGVCVVACNFDNPCECGVERITREGVFCVDCGQAAACGNAVCEPGEDDGTCPLDCGAVCPTGSFRCNGPAVEECIGGSWRSTACGPGQTCVLAGSAVGYCATSVAPYDPALPEVSAPVVPPRDWRAIRFPSFPLACRSSAEPSRYDCRFEAFVFDDERVLLNSGGVRILLDTTDGTLDPHPDTSLPAPTFPDRAVAACSGQRTPQWFDRGTGVISSVDPIVDDVISSACNVATVSADGGWLVAGVSIDESPLVGVWELPSGRLHRVLRYENPDTRGLEQSSVHVSDRGEVVYETRYARFSAPPRRAVTVVWNVDAGTYAGVVERGVKAARPGHLGWLDGLAYIALDENASWERPTASGTELLGFTPDGEYVWGRSLDGYGVSRLTLFDADTGRVFHRFAFSELAQTGTQDPAAPTWVFGRSGRFIKIGGQLFGTEPLP